MENIIAVYGKTCTLKTEVAREISRLTGFKLTNRGELATTRAKVAKLSSAHRLPLEVHRAIDAETLEMTRRDEPLMIFESAFMDAVLKDVKSVFFVHLSSRDPAREARWTKRKEEGGGRTRQLGESVAERDREDAQLRTKLYGSEQSGVRPALELDTSDSSAEQAARRILEAFQAESGMQVATGKPAMDKSTSRGVSPGPANGVVRHYNAKRMPFGGYITDQNSGRDIFVHKSAVQEGALEKGQRVRFDIVEDSFGGFKAVNVRAA